MSIKNDGHYFCRAGGNRPDGLNEPVTDMHFLLEDFICAHISRKSGRVPDRLRQRMDKLRLQRVRKDRTG
ncbi:hypothetical protein FRO02_24820 [Escherichia coli]|nr:hypothetical protein [Escherichia coli]EFD1025854.1 hypothetical protein [Escherichia coli]